MLNRYISIFVLILFVAASFLIITPAKVYAQGPTCVTEIVHQATPADGTPFVYLLDSASTPPEATLSDPGLNKFFVIHTDSLEVTSDPPAGWALENIDCVITQGTQDNVDITILRDSVIIDPVEGVCGVVCTFNNISASEFQVPTLSEWGLVAMASILGIVGFMVMRRRKAAA